LATEAEEELADGLVVEMWDRGELRRRAPYLSDMFIGAKYCATDGVANPIRSVWGLAVAAQRAGATLLTHTEAVDVELREGQVTSVLAEGRDGELTIETPLLILAGGAFSSQLDQPLGLDIPIEPARNFIGVTQRVTPFFTEFVSSHDMHIYFRPARTGQVHVGGVGVTTKAPNKIVPAEGLPHLARVATMVPSLRDTNFLRAWAGTLAMTPDRLPMATGFSGHGFCLGPIVGKLLSEWVLDGEPSMSLDELNLSRFA
jgi:sarcosine oxidase subunit beta